MCSERKNPTEEAPAASSFKPALRCAARRVGIFCFVCIFFFFPPNIFHHGASRALEVDIAQTGSSRHNHGLQLAMSCCFMVLKLSRLQANMLAPSDAMQTLESHAISPAVLKIPAQWRATWQRCTVGRSQANLTHRLCRVELMARKKKNELPDFYCNLECFAWVHCYLKCDRKIKT